MNNTNSGRVGAIDKIRVISILGVILIHTTTRTLEQTAYDLVLYNWTLYLNQVARFSVPLFFLISGLVLEITNSKKVYFWEFIKKRLTKVLLPYITWSFFYYYLFYTTNKNSIVYTLLTGDASYQLYFIPALCLFYLFFPIMHNNYKRIFNLKILIPLFIFLVYAMYYDYFIKNIPYTDAVRVAILGFIYFLIGMLSAHYRNLISIFSNKFFIPITIIFTYLGYFIYREGLAGYYNTFNIHSFYSSWRPSVIVYVLVSFAFFLKLFEKFDFSKLAKLSFSVFFLHVIFIEFIWKYLREFVSPNLYFDILFFVVVTLVSFTASFLLHKIPHLPKFLA